MTPPSDKAIEALTAHARQRTADSRRKIQRALGEMTSHGDSINVNAVANRARVSRRTIYKNQDLYDKIRSAAGKTRKRNSSIDNEDSVIVATLRAQLAAKDHEINELMAQLQEGRETITQLTSRLESHAAGPDEPPG